MKGGFGSIRRIEHEGKCYAVKKLSFEGDEEAKRRFQNEKDILSKLRCEFIAPVVELPDEVYRRNGINKEEAIVTPFYSSIDHASLTFEAYYGLKELSDMGNLFVIRQILAGLLYAHKEGILHRDLKPQNVCFEEDRDGCISVRIIDWGLGRNPSNRITEKGATLQGTPGWADSSLVSFDQTNEQTDVYGAGMLYRYIFKSSGPIHPKYKEVAERMISNDLKWRYESVNEVIKDLGWEDAVDEELKNPTRIDVAHQWDNESIRAAVCKFCEQEDIVLKIGKEDRQEMRNGGQRGLLSATGITGAASLLGGVFLGPIGIFLGGALGGALGAMTMPQSEKQEQNQQTVPVRDLIQKMEIRDLWNDFRKRYIIGAPEDILGFDEDSRRDIVWSILQHIRQNIEQDRESNATEKRRYDASYSLSGEKKHKQK